MREVYLDNSSTTKVCDRAVQKMMDMMTKNYGNPSSLHTKGFEAEKSINNVKKILADFIGCKNSEIYFTSGGTESNNIAILGTVNSKKRNGNKIVTTAVEHASVLETMRFLEKQGFEVEYIKPNVEGKILLEQFENAIDDNTILVSCMMVNNETGNIYPVEKLKDIIEFKKSRALLHIDAVQAFCKIPIKVNKIKADLISFSAHKIHGPKGIGGLFISDNVRVSPLFFGGGQEKGMRPGTQSTPLIAGFGEAILDYCDSTGVYDKILELNSYLRERLLGIKYIFINSSDRCLPYILNFSISGIKSETMLHFLSSKGIYVSSGSACSKGKKSYVLNAMEVPINRIDSAIRVSFSRHNTKDDIDYLVSAIKEGMNKIAKI